MSSLMNQESIVQLAQELIRTPSQGGVDSPLPVIALVRDWLRARGLGATVLSDAAGEPVAIVCEIGDATGSRPVYCLDAPLDTAPVGDVGAWSTSPFSGHVHDGWLYGRGSADCKVAVSIFAHIAVKLSTLRLHGKCIILFDADEHTGRFGGVRAFTQHVPRVDGVYIGYPGNHGVIVGARGFYRVRIRVFGTSAHSGTSKNVGMNAVVKAARLVELLSGAPLPRELPSSRFQFGPKLTVTAMHGGSGFSMIPDMCELNVDVRTTPCFSSSDAARLIEGIVMQLDLEMPDARRTAVYLGESWPAYELDGSSELVSTLRRAASRHLGRSVPALVCGPSNIGNYLASRGVAATCGFGVTYRNIHAADECVELSTIPVVYYAYLDAIMSLLRG